MYFVRLWAFLSLHDFEFDVVAFLQAFVPFAIDRAVVDEDVRTIIAPDESEALRIIEPFHLASGHFLFLRASRLDADREARLMSDFSCGRLDKVVVSTLPPLVLAARGRFLDTSIFSRNAGFVN
jgi:hypothetical protein